MEWIFLGALAAAAFVVLGVVWTALSLVLWLVVLPFKLLGLVFKGLATLFMLPFLLLFGFVGFLVLGAGIVALLIPALPLVLVALAVWWLVRRRGRPAARAF